MQIRISCLRGSLLLFCCSKLYIVCEDLLRQCSSPVYILVYNINCIYRGTCIHDVRYSWVYVDSPVCVQSVGGASVWTMFVSIYIYIYAYTVKGPNGFLMRSLGLLISRHASCAHVNSSILLLQSALALLAVAHETGYTHALLFTFQCTPLCWNRSRRYPRGRALRPWLIVRNAMPPKRNIFVDI